jgi:hypothetical protein
VVLTIATTLYIDGAVSNDVLDLLDLELMEADRCESSSPDAIESFL